MRCALALLLLAASAAPAAAAPLAFAERAAFRAAAGPLAVERFEGCGAVTEAFAGPLSAAEPAGPCGAGAILPGVTFMDDAGPEGHALYLAAPRYAANDSTALGQNDPAHDALNIVFDAPVAAVGLDLFQNFGGGEALSPSERFTVRLFDAAGTLLGEFGVEVPGERGAFFGAVDRDAGIARVSVNHPLAFELIDNVAFTAAQQTPAPGPLALLALGLAALARRR